MSDNIDCDTVSAITGARAAETPLIAMFKKSFRKAGLMTQDFRIDPFSCNNMSEWYEAIVADEDEDVEPVHRRNVYDPNQNVPVESEYESEYDSEYDSEYENESVYSEPSPSLIQTVAKGVFDR